MEYTIQKLARLAGVSTRTLRHYDQLGLLAPARRSSSGYRIYGQREVDTLQQIMFFRELGLELSAIAGILQDPEFDPVETLRGHLAALEQQRARLDLLISNVEHTISEKEGSTTMSDKEKFAGFKEKLVADNEAAYGEEIREKYGDEAVNESNARMMNLTQEQYDAMTALGAEILEKLKAAVKAGADPAGETGREVAELHRQWLSFTWGARYSPEAHCGLAQMYLDDPRFTAHYDSEVPGCAQFLRDAVWAVNS